MVEENTQYGLKNYLKVESLSHISKNLFKAKLLSKDQELYLNILFLDKNTIRFHYSFKSKFDIKTPNGHLNFDVKEVNNLELNERDEFFEIQSPDLLLKIKKEKLQIQIFDTQGRLISSDFQELGFYHNKKTKEVRVYKSYKDIENPR